MICKPRKRAFVTLNLALDKLSAIVKKSHIGLSNYRTTAELGGVKKNFPSESSGKKQTQVVSKEYLKSCFLLKKTLRVTLYQSIFLRIITIPISFRLLLIILLLIAGVNFYFKVCTFYLRNSDSIYLFNHITSNKVRISVFNFMSVSQCA